MPPALRHAADNPKTDKTRRGQLGARYLAGVD